jgi:predicted ribonuclease YlaK
VPAVLDTNVLVEFVPPDQVNWGSIIGASPVRLVVPLRVVEELNSLKYDQRPTQRAECVRRLLPQLARWLADPGGAVQLRPDTSIEMDLVTGPRDRPLDGDEEVLQACQEFEQFGSNSVVLVSEDAAIRLRAQALGIRTTQLPDRYSRNPAPDATA